MKRLNVNCVLPVLALMICLASCNGKKYKIEGKSSLTSLDGKTLYLRGIESDGQWVTVDSAEVVHGYFKMEGEADSARLLTLCTADGEGIMPLVAESGKLEITISGSQLSARGTPLNDALYDFIDKHNKMRAQIDELERKEARMVLDGANLDDIHEQLAEEGEKLAEEMNIYVKTFITDNFENPLGPGVFMMVCGSMPYPIITPEIEDIMRIAPSSFKEDPFVKDFLTKAKENEQLIKEHARLQQNMAEK